MGWVGKAQYLSLDGFYSASVSFLNFFGLWGEKERDRKKKMEKRKEERWKGKGKRERKKEDSKEDEEKGEWRKR